MKKNLLYGILVFLFALFFFSAGITDKSIWYDETLSLIISAAPMSKIFFFLKYYSPHPPLYFLLLKPFTYFDSLFMWRFLSVIFAAIGSVAIFTYFSSKKLYLAILLSLLYIVAPISLYYSQEIRMYAMMEGTSALVMVLLFKCYEGECRFSEYIFLYLVAIIFALTHYFSMLILAGILGGLILFYLLGEKKRKILNLFFPVLTGFIVIFAWYNYASHALKVAQSGGRIWHLGAVYYFSMLSKYYHMPVYLGLLITISIILAAVFKIFHRKNNGLTELVILSIILTPFLLLNIHPPQHWLNPRYFIALLPVYIIETGNLIIAVENIWKHKKHYFSFSFIILWVLFLFFALKYDFYYFKNDKHAWKSVVKDYVIKDGGSQVFIFEPPYMMVSFTFNLPINLEKKLEVFHVPNRVVSWRRISLETQNKVVFIAHPSFALRKKIFSQLKSRGYQIYLVSNKAEKGYIPDRIYRVIEGKLYVYQLSY